MKAPFLSGEISRWLFLFVVVTAPSAAGAQAVPDTTAPWRYYPLGFGDVWEYHVVSWDWEPTREERWEIVADTVVADTAYAVQVRSWWSADEGGWVEQERLLLRFDTLTTRVMKRTETGERPEACNLSAAFGAAVDCDLYGPDGEPEDHIALGEYGGTVDVGGQTVPVEAKKRFSYLLHPPPIIAPEYAAPIGYVRGYGDFCVPCDEWLLYARVGGVEYGVPVAAEPGPAAPERVLSLVIAPNPVRSETTIRLTLPDAAHAHVAVYDALGRRVVLLHDGVLPAGMKMLVLDASALSQGVYVVRATAGERSATARIVVR